MILSIISVFCRIFSGSPSSDSGSRINIAPYFFAIGRSDSNFTISYEIELISALPGYRLRAASMTSTWLESMDRGRLVRPLTVSIARSIISFSSMPLMPILTSRILAPHASCSSAKADTISIEPSRSCACNFFFPVGLMRSPMIIKLSFKPKATVFRSLVR